MPSIRSATVARAPCRRFGDRLWNRASKLAQLFAAEQACVQRCFTIAERDGGEQAREIRKILARRCAREL
jgi:hypothetical protein